MRLVEWSFQTRNTTFYSSIVAKKGFNLLMAIALNDSFKLALIDIRAALLPAKSLERYIFFKPTEDQRKSRKLWKLKKLL